MRASAFGVLCWTSGVLIASLFHRNILPNSVTLGAVMGLTATALIIYLGNHCVRK